MKNDEENTPIKKENLPDESSKEIDRNISFIKIAIITIAVSLIAAFIITSYLEKKSKLLIADNQDLLIARMNIYCSEIQGAMDDLDASNSNVKMSELQSNKDDYLELYQAAKPYVLDDEDNLISQSTKDFFAKGPCI